MRKIVGITLSALAIAVAVALPATGAEDLGPIGDDFGAFEATCQYSHTLPDDPIVFPRGPGASHPHDFFGPASTNAFSTNESIAQGPSTCLRFDSPVKDSDRSAYWVPTLSVADVPIQPITLAAYYKTGRRPMRSIEPFPVGLRMIAGTATGGNQFVNGERVYAFMCPGGAAVNGTFMNAPTCKTQMLEKSIRFPDCWDGINLDSPDHKSHMAYSRPATSSEVRTCPPTHPRMMPKLDIIVRYATYGGPAVRIASGRTYTAHADFMNAWDPAQLAALVRDCLNTDKYCGTSNGPAHH